MLRQLCAVSAFFHFSGMHTQKGGGDFMNKKIMIGLYRMLRPLIAFMTVGDQIAGGIKSIQTELLKIVNPIAIIAVIGCGLYLLLGSDPQYIKKAKSWGIAILVGLVIINVADDIVGWAASIGDGGASTGE